MASLIRLQQQQEDLHLKTGDQAAFTIVAPAWKQQLTGLAVNLPIEDSRPSFDSVELWQREQLDLADSTGAGQLLINHPAESFAD